MINKQLFKVVARNICSDLILVKIVCLGWMQEKWKKFTYEVIKQSGLLHDFANFLLNYEAKLTKNIFCKMT
jgi:hypothetical protein